MLRASYPVESELRSGIQCLGNFQIISRFYGLRRWTAKRIFSTSNGGSTEGVGDHRYSRRVLHLLGVRQVLLRVGLDGNGTIAATRHRVKSKQWVCSSDVRSLSLIQGETC